MHSEKQDYGENTLPMVFHSPVFFPVLVGDSIEPSFTTIFASPACMNTSEAALVCATDQAADSSLVGRKQDMLSARFHFT